MKRAVGGFLVSASLMSLSACALMRTPGPCYGYGCSALHGASGCLAQIGDAIATDEPKTIRRERRKLEVRRFEN